LDWAELGSVAPDQVRLPDIGDRLDAEPWAGAEPVDLASVAESVQRSLDEAGIELEPFDRFRS
jgi:hypothetical protein